MYDIHGNIEALEAVLGDPRAAEPDVVIVGGDAVPGPFAAATLARLAQLGAAARWVRGNGEREVAAAARGDKPPGDGLAGVTAEATAADIGRQAASALGELPLTIGLEGVLYCHASPRRDDELLTRLSSAERYSAALSGIKAGVVVAGHTHQQDDREVGGCRFVNAGSVGLPYEGDGAARWLWVSDGVPDLRQTEYDAAGAGNRMLAAGWPDEDSVTGALIEPIDALVVTRQFEAGAGGTQSSRS